MSQNTASTITVPLAWTTPRLEPLGTIADVHADAAGGSDDDGFGALAAS